MKISNSKRVGHFLCHFDATVTMLTMYYYQRSSNIYKYKCEPHSVIFLLKKYKIEGKRFS